MFALTVTQTPKALRKALQSYLPAAVMSLRFESEALGTLSGRSIYDRLFLNFTLEPLGVLLTCLRFGTGSQYVAVVSPEICVDQAGLDLTEICIPLPWKSWD